MKLARFFDKFELFADAPNAVAKMRELVLKLAVQGRLVPQDSRAVSAAQELAKLDIGICELDPRFDIPTNWVWAPLEPLLLMMKNGFNGKPNKLGGHYKITRIETIAHGTIDMSRIGFADNLPATVVEKHLIQNGDILFSHINSEPHLGKTAICTFDDPALIHGVNLLLLRSKPQIAPQYLNTAFRELRVAGYFISIAQRAINQSSINQKNLGKTLVPVPPLAEQKRIVAKVDELMALCDRLEAQQQERDTRHAALARSSLARFAEAPTPADLDFLFHKSYAITPADLRKSILTLAVQGKLVPQDPNDEPAEDLYVRIQSVKERLIKQRVIKRASVNPVSPEERCDPLPPGWLWTRLGDAFDVRDGTHDTPKYTNQGFPLVTSKNIYSGRLSFDGASFISEKDHRKICERSRVDRGDILLAMIGSIGNPVIVDTDTEFSIKNVALFKYYASADAEPRYLLLYLRLVSEEMKARSAGGVQSFVSLGFLRDYPFPLPPLAEQRRIVAKVDQLMALVDQLETQLTTARARAEKLMDAVVAELTAQG